ncbi:MAG: hypothetical protein GY711_09785, partial [bacterium]|nr:hypothetical protein [bacterium]
HTAGYGGGCGGSSTGWYLDEIEIVRNVPVFTGDFESGWAGWGADRGVWDVGSPTTGPAAAFEGLNVAGTALDGNYGANTDSRLISPTVRLDTVVAGEELHLRFREWFSYDHCDAGYVQISTYDTGTGTWADWVTLSPYVEHTSPWSLKDVDLTAYAGQVARVAFYHTAGYGGGCGGSSTGWYLDEIEIVRNVPVFTGDFESGWAGWGADRGVWDVGSPTTGPAAAFEGLNVAGTALDGNYGANTDSRLISPTVRLDGVPPNGEVHVRFWEWTSFGHCDGGSVQVSAYDPGTGAWVDWVTVGSASASVPSWSLRQVDLTAYAGQQVRLAFYHTAAYGGGCGGSSHGWFIDEVRVQHRVGTTYCSPAVDNSTGAPAEIRAIGSDVVDQNQLDVFATGMPNSQFGYFLASETQGLIPHPGGSPGTLCVVGTIARFNAPIENSGADGSFSIAVDLTQIPTSPAHAVTGGETWHFQAWYRDGGSSNFTDAVSVLFR